MNTLSHRFADAVIDHTKRLGHTITRGAVAITLGVAAMGVNNNPDYLVEASDKLPVLNEAARSVGEFLSQHQNPTVAGLGLTAIAVAANKGPLFGFRLPAKKVAPSNLARKATQPGSGRKSMLGTPNTLGGVPAAVINEHRSPSGSVVDQVTPSKEVKSFGRGVSLDNGEGLFEPGTGGLLDRDLLIVEAFHGDNAQPSLDNTK